MNDLHVAAGIRIDAVPIVQGLVAVALLVEFIADLDAVHGHMVGINHMQTPEGSLANGHAVQIQSVHVAQAYGAAAIAQGTVQFLLDQGHAVGVDDAAPDGHVFPDRLFDAAAGHLHGHIDQAGEAGCLPALIPIGKHGIIPEIAAAQQCCAVRQAQRHIAFQKQRAGHVNAVRHINRPARRAIVNGLLDGPSVQALPIAHRAKGGNIQYFAQMAGTHNQRFGFCKDASVFHGSHLQRVFRVRIQPRNRFIGAGNGGKQAVIDIHLIIDGAGPFPEFIPANHHGIRGSSFQGSIQFHRRHLLFFRFIHVYCSKFFAESTMLKFLHSSEKR